MPNKKALKIVQINTVPNGSTGSIMMSIHKQLLEDGYDSYVVWGRGRKAQNDHEIYMNDRLGVYFHVLYSRLTGKTGFASKRATKKLIKKLDEIKPDIIHLHNLHGYYINIELLFNYIKKNNIKTVWTLHDCWAFTGHCSYFDKSDCRCWQGEKCKSIKTYPKCIINNSMWCYKKKKDIITGIRNLTIVTPSKWLNNLAQRTFLNAYKIELINNGVNTDVFKKIKLSELTFKRDNNISNKKIILGVASPWNENKGLEDFIKLSKIIDHNKYKIVLVGLTNKQISKIPKDILCIKKTNEINKLVELYNEADIFFNPTKADNYPTVNLESIACGTPVITYNTGGSGESANYFGFTIEANELGLINEKTIKNLRINRETISLISEKRMYLNYKHCYINLDNNYEKH